MVAPQPGLPCAPFLDSPAPVIAAGTAAVYHMREAGWVKISADNVRDLHYQYAEEKAAAQ